MDNLHKHGNNCFAIHSGNVTQLFLNFKFCNLIKFYRFFLFLYNYQRKVNVL